MSPTKFLGLLLVIVYVVALKVFSLLDIGSIFEQRLLLPILNTLFAGLIPIAIALIAGKTYSKSGSSTVLFMGCGMLSFGLCAISAGWLIRASDGANLNVTVYNTGAFLGSLFHAIGATLSLVGVSYPSEISTRRLRVVLGYFGILMFVVCFSLAALKGWTPPFFVQGVGPTELRQAILGSAVLMYVVSSIFLMAHYFKGKTDFLYWYSLCLAMLAIGLFAFFVQKSVGSPIGWLGRSANYFGGIFAAVAVLRALRDARGKSVQVEQSIADLFTGRRATLGYGILAVLPLPIFLFLLLVVSSLGAKTVFEPPGLFAALNTLFLTILPLAMVFLAVRSFLQTGLISLLMLANGTLAFGLGSLLSGWVMTMANGGTNATVTIFNCAALVALTFHLTAATMALVGVRPKKDFTHKEIAATITCAGTIFLLLLLTKLTLMNVLPVFFVQGEGATAIRQVVLGSATAISVVSASFLWIMYFASKVRFLYWYSLTLFLIAIGLICFMSHGLVGSPLSWLGRSSIYLSGIYLLIAVTSASSELRARGESLEAGIANLFRHRLESLVEERTLQLTQAKEALQAAHNELERANVELELRVKDRTAELESTNEKLILEIENRERAETSVTAERKRLYGILETMPVMVCLLTQDYHVAFANRSFRDKFGEDNGRRCHDYCFELKEPCEFCESYNVLKTGEAHYWEVNAPDGSIIAAYDFPFADTDGSPLILKIDIDITEQRRAEQDLRESENRYRQMFEKNRAVKLLIDPESSEIIDANQAASDFYGYELNRLKQMKITDINALSPQEIFHEMSLAYAEQKNYFRFQHRVASGELRYVEVYSTPLDAHGKRLLYSIVHDITDRHRAEEELIRSNEDLQQFAYVASHDLQEPLRNVASCLQMLEKEYKNKLGPNADEYINYAIEGAVRMKALILDLLAYSRVSTRGKPLEQTDCEQILERALKNLSVSVTETGAVITHDALPAITADDTQLLQVFQNLIQNALKFRREAPPQVHLSAARNKNEWIFSIKDNGIGIESRHLERIFVIFQRLHKRSQYDGTGMGLAITKKIVERHGGQIWAESEPGVGATFYFTIPEKGLQI